jgi:hypothetical protein
MSKSARPARVASRQRPEIITGDKTITANESGELYLINYNTGAKITITLPPIQEALYYRFQFMSGMSANAAQVNIATQNGAGTLKGTLWTLKQAGSSANTTLATNKDSSSTVIAYSGSVTAEGTANEIHVGTYLDVYCDGTNWQASGVTIASHLSASVFAIV